MARELVLAFEAAPPGEAEAPGMMSGMDEEGFRLLYERNARPLRSYLSRMSGDRAAADDLLQETFLRFLRARPPEMDGDGRRRYLFRIATNLLRDRFRGGKWRHEPLPELPSGGGSAEKSHLRLDLGRLLMRLKPRDRQLLWLAYVEGSSHDEIAEIAGLKSQSIRPMLFRARQRLARLLRQKGLGPAIESKVKP